MSIKFHYDIEAQDYYVIKIHTCSITLLILIIRILMSSPISFLTEISHLNLDKGEVMHNEETI